MKLFWDGLKFGMLLQMAIGPMCLMVFNTAKNVGFWVALTLVLAITFVDAFYIVLSCVGISKLLDKEKSKKVLKWISSVVLLFFGTNIIFNVFGVKLIPGMSLRPSPASIFVQGLVLTLSNPLTIIFWTGVLTSKIINDGLKKKQLINFSFGLVSASLIFLSFVAISGTLLSNFIQPTISDLLNILVGAFIVSFGIRLLIAK